MKYPVYMNSDESSQIEYDVVSDDLRIYLTRVLRNLIQDKDPEGSLIRQNRVINRSLTIAGKKIYVLTADENGDYMPQEYAWHNGEMELVFRRLSTPQFAEYLAELVQAEYFDLDDINVLLEKDGVSFRIKCITRFGSDAYILEVLSLDDLADLDSADTKRETHPNIRVLVDRMDRSLAGKDLSLIHI